MSPFAKYYLDEPAGTLHPAPMDDSFVGNPLLPTLTSNLDQRKNLFGIFYGEVRLPFVEGLSYRLSYSNNMIVGRRNTFVPAYRPLNAIARIDNASSESQDMFLENLVKYNRTFAETHTVDVTLLYNYNYADNYSVRAQSTDLPTEALTYYGLKLGGIQTTDAGFSDYRATAAMARVNYKFKDRYLLTLTARRDAASVFSANNKYALFPSAALGWVVSEESFFQGVRGVDFLKLRASYGANGNQIGRYSSLSRINAGGGLNYTFGDGPTTAFGTAKASMGNPDLKWESTYAANFGMDFDVIGGRISGSVDYYDSRTYDLLYSRTIPTLNGFSTWTTNVGQVNNKGVELMLNSVNLRTDNFEWTTGFNIARNRNTVVDVGTGGDDIGRGLFLGHPLGVIYTFQTDGVWQIGDEIPAGFQEGDLRLVDQNGDGRITPADDRVVIGSNNPNFTYGLNNTARYKGLMLLVQITGSHGGIQNNNGVLNPSSNLLERLRGAHVNWWTVDNPTHDHPSVDYANALGVIRTESLSYLRVQDISLSYDLPKGVLDQWGMAGLRFYVSSKNPFLFTNWSGWDPDLPAGINQFPQMKSLIFGLNFSF
jgi:TonB-linked SusC/RagA family outer membrane protein